MEKISSEQNQTIKNILRIRDKSRNRKKDGLFLIDGYRELKEAISAGFIVEDVFLCPEIFKKEVNFSFKEIGESVFNKICYKTKPDGCLALVNTKESSLKDIDLDKNLIILVLESVEKPGNLGAIIRTAYAANVDAIIINNNQTDIYNPNVIRASQGLVFKIPVILSNIKETKEFLNNNNIKIVATSLKADKKHTEVNMTGSIAFLMGTESDGLTDGWLSSADELLKIPMQNNIDSLNVSVATAIVVYEALRQRGF